MRLKSVRTAKAQTSLCISADWSESSLSACRIIGNCRIDRCITKSLSGRDNLQGGLNLVIIIIIIIIKMVQRTLFIPTLDTTTKFVVMTI